MNSGFLFFRLQLLQPVQKDKKQRSIEMKPTSTNIKT